MSPKEDRSAEIEALRARASELAALNESLEQRLAATTRDLASANERLDESRERFRVFAENVPELFSYVGTDERYQFVNKGYEVLFRRPSSEIVGLTVRELIGDEGYRLAAPQVAAALSGRAVRYEAPFPLGEGIRMMDVRYVPDRDEAGRVRGLFSLVTDVTEKRLGEQELSRSRDRLDAIVSTAADAIITLDRNGIIESFNRAAESMFGYAADEIVGADVRQLLEIPEASPPPSLERPSRWGALADSELGQAREADGHRKDGTSFPVEVAVSEIGGGEAFTAIARDIELRKRYREELLRSREALRSLSARLITAEENERRRISLELHDDFSQRLAMLAVDVEHLAGSRGDEEARRRLEAVGRSLADLTDDMHRLAYTLHPSMLDHLGLAAALRRHLEDLSARHPLEVVLSERGFGTDLGTEAASCLYRVAQESLSNVVKHSGGRRVTVRLSGTPQAVRLTIRDMGKGFDVEAARQRQTLGLTSMEERIRLLGGTFSLRSRPGTGTVVQATCPRRPPHR